MPTSQTLKILAIDTALDNCSVSLMINNEVHTHSEFAPKQQAKLILPMINDLLTQNKTTLNELDLLAFGCGPAGFTGTRIAAGIIQGLALGANLPILPISTLQAMAQGAYREFGAKNVMVCLDARMQEVYWGIYQLTADEIMQGVVQDTICKPEQIPLVNLNEFIAVGDGWSVYNKELLKQLPNKPKKIVADYNSTAQDIAYLAKKFFLEGKSFTAEQAVPIYLRGAAIWKKNSVNS